MPLKLKISCLLVLSAFICMSCSFSGSGFPDSQIVGEWEWIRSSGGFAGRIVTPDSSGYDPQQINFTPTNRFSLYHADSLARSGHYLLSRQKEEAVINYAPSDDAFMPEQWVRFKGPDTLILSDRCNDCYTNTYIRK